MSFQICPEPFICIVMAHIVIAHTVMAHIVVAHTVPDLPPSLSSV